MGSVEYIISILNSFQFTYAMEKKCCLSFLDVLLTRNGNNIVTTDYCKTTTNDLYINWNLFTSTSWKRGIIKTLIDRADLISS